MEYVNFFVGMLAILGLALLANLNNWRQIKIRYVIQLLLVELLLAWFLLNSSVGVTIVGALPPPSPSYWSLPSKGRILYLAV